jgi:hypothetical protein
MDLPGSTYLYTLAAVSVTFVGFSALVIVLRQTFGGTMSRLEILITRIFIQLGFIVAASALLPNLMSLFSLPHPFIWRVASAVAAAPSLLFAATYPARRRAASGIRTPLAIWLDVFVLVLAAAILISNAIGVGYEPGPGPYAAGLTVILFLSGWAYLQALSLVLRHHLNHRDDAPDS